MTSNDRPNLYDLAPSQLHATLSGIVSPPFRAKQIAEWMYSRGAASCDAMSNVPREVRASLAGQFTLAFPEVVERTEAVTRADLERALKWRRDHPKPAQPGWSEELDAFEAEARSLLVVPPPELPADVFAPGPRGRP